MASTIALLGYVLLLALAAALIVVHRSVLVLGGKKAPNTFAPTGEDMSAFGQRASRVHANLYENVGVYCVPLLAAMALNLTHVTDGLAYVMLGARLGQCMVHWLGATVPLALIRATFFGVQIIIGGYWAVQLLLQVTAS